MQTNSKQRRSIPHFYPANSYQRNRDPLQFQLAHDLPVSFQAKNGTQILFCRRVPVRPQPDIIRPLCIMPPDIFNSISRSPNDHVYTQKPPRLAYRHILLTEMNAVCPYFKRYLYPVVNDQHTTIGIGDLPCSQRRRPELPIGCLFHSQLYPFDTRPASRLHLLQMIYRTFIHGEKIKPRCHPNKVLLLVKNCSIYRFE